MEGIRWSHLRSLGNLPGVLALSEEAWLYDNSVHGEAPRLVCDWTNGAPEWLCGESDAPEWAKLAVAHVPKDALEERPRRRTASQGASPS